MRSISSHIRHNVVGYVALFFALTGGVAWATHPGGANTINSADIINGEVKNADLAANAVGSGKIADRQVKNADLSIGASSSNTIADGGIQGVDVKNGTLTGAHIENGSLGTIDFSSSIPAARVTHNTSQSIPSETALTPLSFNTERYDTANMHDLASSHTELTAPVDGIYAITAQVAWEGNSTGHRLVGFRVDGSRFIAFERVEPASQAVTTGSTNQEVTTQAHLQAGAAVQVVVSQTNSTDAALDIFAQPEWTPEFSMTWLAPGP